MEWFVTYILLTATFLISLPVNFTWLTVGSALALLFSARSKIFTLLGILASLALFYLGFPSWFMVGGLILLAPEILPYLFPKKRSLSDEELALLYYYMMMGGGYR